MKNAHVFKPIPVIMLAGILMSLLMLSGIAHAVGTPAGTVITNKATATFTDANNNTYAPVDSNVVSVTVSQVAGLTVTPATSNQNAAPGGTAHYSIAITNTGNGSDTFTVSSAGLPAGWSTLIYKDTNGDGVLQPAEEVPGNLLGTSITLAADQVQRAIAVVSALGSAVSGTVGTLNITATSAFTPAQTQTVAAITTIQAAVLSVTKAVSPASPKPGDTVTYTIQWSNTGTASAFVTLVNDPIPANTTYKPGSITFGGVARTDAGGDDNADFNITNPGKVTVNVGTVAAGGSGTITFQVTVNAGIASGTGITNTASVSYQTNPADPTTQTTVNTNSIPFSVAQSAGVQVLPATLTTNQLVGDQNLHPFTVKNTGNGTDTYTLSSVGLFWTWTLYNDVNQDGVYTAGIDTPVTDTNADGKLDTGPVAAGVTKYYVGVTTVSGSNGQQGKHTLTATSISDPAISGTSIKYTNVQTPVIALVKSVSPTGPQPPNTQLTYTVVLTNSGSVDAKNFVMSDVLNSNLSYVPGSITVAGAGQTDAADTDLARYDSASGTVIVSIPSISANASFPVVYKATIK